tara:strand:+ start:360 stop:572 length:213 start_codon:yes stop_codon:yes gene_type:complete
MERYAPGVYQIELPTGVASFSLYIDNKRVFLQGNQSFTAYVQNVMNFDTGKMFVTYIGDNIKNISGAVAG